MSFAQNFKIQKELQGLSNYKIAKLLNCSQSTVANWLNGNSEPSPSQVTNIALVLKCGVADLIDNFVNNKKSLPQDVMQEQSNVTYLDNKKIHLVPLYGSVSAGFGAYACSDVIDYIPLFIKNPFEVKDTICITIKGDSMSPKIEDGDVAVVHKQTSVDSGSIAVILVDGEEGYIKKVVYGSDWVELISLNPDYPTRRFEGESLLRLNVVGLVKQIIKQI